MTANDTVIFGTSSTDNGMVNELHYTPSLFTGILVTAVDGTIAIVGTLGNVLVLTVIFVQIRFSTVSNILIANLAAIDLVQEGGGVSIVFGYLSVTESS